MKHQELTDLLEAAAALLRHATPKHRTHSAHGTKQGSQLHAKFMLFNRSRLWEEQMEAGAGARAFKK